MNNIPNLLLAAGASRRMGTPKQLLPWRGKTLIEHQIETLLKTDQEVYVVLGAHAERILPVLKPYPVNPIIFEQWSLGMGNTIAFSVAYLIKKQGSMDGILIALTDQPLVDTSHYNALLDAFQKEEQQLIVSVSDQGWEGVPVLFDKYYFPGLLNLKGEQGAKKIIQSTKKSITNRNAGPLLVDMDTPEVYTALYKKFNPQ